MKHSYKQKGLLLAALALASTAAQAQADFRPGYLVRPAGDTVRGLVDYRGARRGGQQCVFRAVGDKASTAFEPAQLRGYGLASGERFVSQRTPGAAQLPALARAGTPADTAGQGPRLRFLEVLVQGPATLLGWRDDQGREHYYVHKAGAPLPIELVEVRRQVPDGSTTREQVLPVYRGTLTEQFADSPAVLLSLSRVRFEEPALVAAVAQYNACRQPGQAPTAAAASPARFGIGLEVLLGAQASRTTYTTSTTSADVPAGLAPEVGVALLLGRRTARQKLAFRPELHYVRQVAEASASEQVYYPGSNQTVTQRYDLRFTTAYLRLPLLLRYTVPGTGVRPFVEAGGSLSYATTLDPQRRLAGADWQPLFASRPDLGDALRRYELGLVAGLGVQFPGLLGGHALAVLARVERSDGFILTSDYRAAVLRGSAFVSFSLAKSK